MSSVYSLSLNKKNLKLKNIIFMSPLSRTKLNIPNLITDTKKLLASNSKIDSINLSYFKNKSNDILNKIYRSYSTNSIFNLIILIVKKIIIVKKVRKKFLLRLII